MYFLPTKSELFATGRRKRFCRFCSTSCFLASRSACERINAFCIPTRKHFARRQQLQKRRDLYVTGQSPSC